MPTTAVSSAAQMSCLVIIRSSPQRPTNRRTPSHLFYLWFCRQCQRYHQSTALYVKIFV